jgi:hypothetical protein
VRCSNIFHIEVVVQVNVFHIEVVVNGNFQSKVLLRKRNMMRWELPLCSRPGCIQASKSSSIFSVCTALHHHQFFSNSFIPVWSTSCGTGGVPPGHTMYTMLFIHPGLEHQLWYGRSSPRSYKVYNAFHSSRFGLWSTSRGMGGVPPSHNTVILLCAVSFLSNHDPDLRIFSLRTSGPMTAGFLAFAMTSTQQPSNVWRRQATRRSSFT